MLAIQGVELAMQNTGILQESESLAFYEDFREYVKIGQDRSPGVDVRTKVIGQICDDITFDLITFVENIIYYHLPRVKRISVRSCIYNKYCTCMFYILTTFTLLVEKKSSQCLNK
jgi:hypothetical protein